MNACKEDSDGDGFTNGDEVGDPCCIWNWGDVPSRTTNISHPGTASIVPPGTSCLLSGSPASITGLNIITGQNQVQLSWNSPSVCVCSYQVFYIILDVLFFE